MVKGLQELIISAYEMLADILSYLGTTITAFSNMSTTNNITNTVNDILILFATSLLVLFFLLEFMERALNPDWVTLPNLTLFFMKGVAYKAILTNCSSLMDGISDIAKAIFDKVNTNIVINTSSGFQAIIDAVRAKPDKMDSLFPLLGYGFLAVIFLLITFYIVFQLFLALVTILIEIQIYKCFAPLPLSTISTSQRTIAIRFIQNYAAVCLRHTILVICVLLVNNLISTIATAEIFVRMGSLSSVGYFLALSCLTVAIKTSSSISKTVVGL